VSSGPKVQILYRISPTVRTEGANLEEMGRRNVTYRDNSATAKTAEPIDLPFLMVSGMCPSSRLLRVHWRHLANTVERLCAATMSGPATRGGDAACSRITFGNVVLLDFRRRKQRLAVCSSCVQQLTGNGSPVRAVGPTSIDGSYTSALAPRIKYFTTHITRTPL